MCGIVAAVSKKDVVSDILLGLQRLEYRGYDSAGIAVIGADHQLVSRKSVGEISSLRERLASEPLAGLIGIGHTRWATHGEVEERNAHPHLSKDGSIAVVHNGTIENFTQLRAELEKEGYPFKSDTDTEVIPHLIERALKKGARSLEDAVASALSQVKGAYAVAVISSEHPDEIVAARFSSPLVVGVANDQLLLASDEAAMAGLAVSSVRLADGDIVTLRLGEGVNIRGRSQADTANRIEKLTAEVEDVTPAPYPTFMEKEVFTQADTLRETLNGRVDRHRHTVRLGGIAAKVDHIRESRGITIVACGTSLYAGQVGKRLIESMTRIPVTVTEASEFIYSNPIIGHQDVIIVISQSGETADTKAAIELGKIRGALPIGITNKVGSSIARAVEAGVYLQVGPEYAVASTKAFTAQCTVLAMMAALLAEGGRGDSMLIGEFVKEIERIPDLVAEALLTAAKIAALAPIYAASKRVIFIGRGYGVPLAREGALKLTEVAYIDAIAYAAGELKHGPLALVEPGVPAICIVPNEPLLRAKTLSNMEEIKARGGEVIAIAADVDDAIRSVARHVIEVPMVMDELAPIVYAPVLQLFALETAKILGRNVDRPRNLAKSVTVE